MASAVTSIYNNIISAASAGFAPTNSADVSAIASSYAESAASSKLDSSASSSFYSIDNPSGFLTAAYTPTFGYNTTDQISSIDGSALGGMDEAAVSGIASAYAESAASSKLDTSASSSFYPSDNPSGFISSVDLTDYSTTAYVDSSVSSKLDATASSQFLTSVPSDYATTAYVDSSVSSKLDATASSQFITSTAGLVGTGDLTAYAYESSNSAKLDTTAFSNVSGTFLTAVPAGYATEAFVNSSISGFAYESAVSGWTSKQDALTFGYDGSNNISSIDGSALAGGGGASYSAGNMISISSDVISFSSQAGITNIVLVTSMPVSPDANVLYLVNEATV